MDRHRGDRAFRGGNPIRAVVSVARNARGITMRRGQSRTSISESVAMVMLERVLSSLLSSIGPSVSLNVPTILCLGVSRIGDLTAFFFFNWYVNVRAGTEADLVSDDGVVRENECGV